MAIKRLATSLNDDQKKMFTEAFYNIWGMEFDFDSDEESGSEAPWGAPWFFGWDVELEGNTIEEMAKNHFDAHKDEIEELTKEEKEENAEGSQYTQAQDDNDDEEEDDDDEEEIDWEEKAKALFESYDEIIDSEGPVSAGGFTFDPSRVLKEMDPIAYKEGFDNYIDSELGENEINKIYETIMYDQKTKDNR